MIESSPRPPRAPSPTVAVITVCWNALPGLQVTADSVKCQNYEGIIHVIVDGGSTDGTVDWLDEHQAQFAVAISERDRGIYDAMNKAIEKCPETDWLIFLNAGDAFHNADVVRHSLPLLARDDLDFVFGDVCILDAAGAGETRTYPSRRGARYEMPGCHQSCFVRSRLMKRNRFDLNYTVAGDFDCWLRATRQCGSKTGFVDYAIATIAPEGFSARNEPTLQREYARAIRTHVNAVAAAWWLLTRKVRRIALKLRAPSTSGST